MKPRAYTPKEVQEMFLNHVRGLARYWATTKLEPERDNVLTRCEGLAFSILTTIDGCSMDLPAVDLVLRPHPDDKKFLSSQGENWFKDGTVINANVLLHEFFHNRG